MNIFRPEVLESQRTSWVAMLGDRTEAVDGNKDETSIGLVVLSKGDVSENVSGNKTCMVGGAIVDYDRMAAAASTAAMNRRGVGRCRLADAAASRHRHGARANRVGHARTGAGAERSGQRVWAMPDARTKLSPAEPVRL